MFTVKSVYETKELIGAHFGHLRTECTAVPLAQAFGRTLFEDVLAPENVPSFDRSMVDGYAVKAADTFGASEAMPAMLSFIGEVRMGEAPDISLSDMECAYVPTGGQLPEGADAMVMIEYAEKLGEDMILSYAQAAPGAHVIFAGDDIRLGRRALERGVLLRPQEIGVLAALGVTEVRVAKPPRVGILSTGDEIVPVGAAIHGTRMRDVNASVLAAQTAESGGEPVPFGIIPDDEDAIFEATRKMLETCDVCVITGGSSVGAKDATARVIGRLGGPGVLLHGVAMKPGKPTILGDVKSKPVFGLPGHPVSAFFVFRMFAVPLLHGMLGRKAPEHRPVLARAAFDYASRQGREEYVPVRLSHGADGLIAHAIHGKSGLITTLSQAEGYVSVARGAEGLRAGNLVEVTLF